MKDPEPQLSSPHVLSEDLAQRVLARAVELDVLAQSGMTVTRLREVARELGIPDAAFDAALAEVQAPAPRPGLLRRWIQRARGPVHARRPWGDVLLANAAAVAAFWAVLGLVTTATRGADLGWQLDAALRLLVGVGGVALARHLRARPVGFVLAITTVAQLAEYAIHLVYGIRAAQGADTHFAVLLAAAIGVAVASLGRRIRHAAAETVTDEGAGTPLETPTRWTLMRTASPARPLGTRVAF